MKSGPGMRLILRSYDGESENGMEGQKENEKQEGKISLTTSQEDNFNLQLLFVSFKLW